MYCIKSRITVGSDLSHGILNAVGPEHSSGASAHTLSPDISNRIRETQECPCHKRGIKNIHSNTTEYFFSHDHTKDVATATCHSGIDGGRVKGINAHVTKKPSEIGCLLTIPNKSSKMHLSANVTAIIGAIVKAPVERFSSTKLFAFEM